MKQILAIVWIFAIIAIALTSGAPTNSPNPQIDTIRRGLIQKLCDNAHGKLKQQNPTVLTSTARPGNTRTLGNTDILGSTVSGAPPRRTTTPTTVDASPTCTDFNNLSFEQLIEKNKALLKPVSTAQTLH